MLDDYRKKGLGETAVAIANAMIQNGLDRSTVLEVGCGIGALCLELVRRGASGAVGVDISPKMIRLARKLADDRGLSGSVSFRLGDGARTTLPAAKIVILDAVLCCYPDVSALVENTSSAAAECYALSVPDDNRFVTRAMKIFLPLQAFVLRRGGFRFFVHPTREIREALEAKGFRMASRSSAGWIWSVLVFRRT